MKTVYYDKLLMKKNGIYSEKEFFIGYRDYINKKELCNLEYNGTVPCVFFDLMGIGLAVHKKYIKTYSLYTPAILEIYVVNKFMLSENIYCTIPIEIIDNKPKFDLEYLKHIHVNKPKITINPYQCFYIKIKNYVNMCDNVYVYIYGDCIKTPQERYERKKKMKGYNY